MYLLLEPVSLFVARKKEKGEKEKQKKEKK